MLPGLSHSLLVQLSEAIAAQTGLHFPSDRLADLEKGIRAAAPALGHGDAESCVNWILSAPLSRKAIEIVASHLTVGETYFLREKRSLEIVAEQILPEIARARTGTERRLRIWSAGCCTGEEPYSIAILIDRHFPEFRQWQVTILGTDINPFFLRKATAGIYSEWSFRDAPPWLKPNYFKQVDGKHFEVATRIKEKVTFSHLNLGEESYPSLLTNTNAMDLIFCRNVLMYFTPERAKKVVGHFHQALVNDGWLIVSPTEVSSELLDPFSAVPFEGMTLHRKGKGPVAAAQTPVLAKLPDEVVIPAPESLLGFIPILPPAVILPEEEAPANTHREALALFKQGRYAEAAERFSAEISSPGTPAESAALLARIWANLGDLSQARSWAERALESDRLNAGWHYLRAMILQEQGAGTESVAAFKRVLYLEPGFVLAHFALGHSALREGKSGEADKYFTNVLGLLADFPPDDVLPHSDGLAAARLREMVESALALEKTG